MIPLEAIDVVPFTHSDRRRMPGFDRFATEPRPRKSRA